MDTPNGTETNAASLDPSKGIRRRASRKHKPTKKSSPKKSNGHKGTKRLTKSEIKAANPTGKCLCGCGEAVPRRFIQGHDAQLHSKVLEAFKAEKTVRVSKATSDYLKTAPWMDSKLAKVVRS